MSQAQADALHDRYRKNFVGRARASRDLALLDGLIADTEALVATALPADVRTVVTDRLTLYRNERAEIAAIQAGGPASIAAWREVEWSEVDFSLYRRHFGGKPRPTRDLGLLGELAADERKHIAAIASVAAGGDARLQARKEQMESNLRLFEAELKAIPEARYAMAPAEEARVLATAANQQFEQWRRNFEGKARATRRPALLERMISALEAIRARMVSVREMGVTGESHVSNITKVGERITHFRGELEKIKAARAQSRTGDIARGLGDAANQVFTTYRAEYSGKARTAADPARLSDLADQLHEIARTMQLLQDERPFDGNAKNLTIVLDHIKMMEREHAAIVEARKKK